MWVTQESPLRGDDRQDLSEKETVKCREGGKSISGRGNHSERISQGGASHWEAAWG